MPPLPDFEQLVRSVGTAEPTELDRVRAAVAMAAELGSLGDRVVTHFVQAARETGCSWAQIGAQMGVSKQAAQQAFVSAPPARRRFRRRPQPAAEPFDRWTDEARAVLVGAQQEAGDLGHAYLGTEHLLVALGDGEALAAVALRRLGVDREAVRRHIEEIIGRGPGGPSGPMPFTPRTKKVLDLAVREALRLHNDDVGTEHLLLALVREGEGVAAQILVQKLGVDLPRVRETVLELLEGGGEPRTPGEPPTG